MSETPAVYKVISAVQAALAKAGIAKERRNEQQGYAFRGIDEVFNALSPILAAEGLVILPRMLTRSVVERQAKSGGVLFYVTVEAEFDMVAAHDGSKHTVRTFGEAMDSGDKATNKAMSAAYKYAAFQTFCIPTEGDNDADATTHEVAPAKPEGYDDWRDDFIASAANGFKVMSEAWLKTATEFKTHWRATESEAKREKLKAQAVAVDEKAQA